MLSIEGQAEPTGVDASLDTRGPALKKPSDPRGLSRVGTKASTLLIHGVSAFSYFPSGGYCKLPDFAWNDWGVGQVERVWDLMDISLLRSATKGIDPSYKT